jgi:hypothetical protein
MPPRSYAHRRHTVKISKSGSAPVKIVRRDLPQVCEGGAAKAHFITRNEAYREALTFSGGVRRLHSLSGGLDLWGASCFLDSPEAGSTALGSWARCLTEQVLRDLDLPSNVRESVRPRFNVVFWPFLESIPAGHGPIMVAAPKEEKARIVGICHMSDSEITERLRGVVYIPRGPLDTSDVASAPLPSRACGQCLIIPPGYVKNCYAGIAGSEALRGLGIQVPFLTFVVSLDGEEEWGIPVVQGAGSTALDRGTVTRMAPVKPPTSATPPSRIGAAAPAPEGAP